MEFRILGCLEIQAGDNRPVPLGRQHDQLVLAALLVNVGRTLPLSRLVDVLWEREPPETAAKQVRNAVSRLRCLLAEHGLTGAIVTEPPGYRLAVAEGCVDAWRFEAMVAVADRAAAEGDLDDAARTLSGALSLWRGPW